MDNLQTENVTIDNVNADAVDTAVNEGTAQVEVTPKTFTEEEYSKAIQSASSKAKNEILKALGVNSIDEFKSLQNTYNSAIQEKETLTSKTTELENELASLKLNMKIAALGVSDEFKDDFMELAEIKMTKTNKSFDEISKEILDKNQHWLVSNKVEKLGNDKGQTEQPTSSVSKELSDKFPWLK